MPPHAHRPKGFCMIRPRAVSHPGSRATPLAWAALALVSCWSLPALADDQGAPHDALHEHMEAMGDDLKLIKPQIRDPEKKDETLAAVIRMQQHALEAKVLVPPRIRAMPASEQGPQILAYRKRMIKLIGELLHLEIAVLESDHEEAFATIERMVKLRFQAHKEFQEE